MRTKNIDGHLITLDSFRGIAALSVVVYHLYVLGAVSEWGFFRHSHLFVPFFFVLSGFVIAYVYDKASFRIKSFMVARSFRILPLYYVMLGAFLALECLNYVLYHKFGMFFKNIPFTGDRGIDQILPNILLLQSWLPWTYPLSFNNPAWSLSVEWYLYIFFAIVMCVPKCMRYGIMFILVVLMYAHLSGFLTSEGAQGIMYFCAGCLMHTFFAYSKDKNLFSPLILTSLEILAIAIGLCVVVFGLKDYAIFAFCLLILVFALSSYARATASRGGGNSFFVRN